MLNLSDYARSQPRTMDDERRYLEGLLNTRFNFYLVFVSLFVFGIFGASLDAVVRGIALIMGGFVSAVISLAVARTFLLVEKALDKLRYDDMHPYALLYWEIEHSDEYKSGLGLLLRYSANNYMLATPSLITLLLLISDILLVWWNP
ncbi:MAG: hypothetical protein ACE5Q6_13090 [Dehalococcoidia bacterium]